MSQYRRDCRVSKGVFPTFSNENQQDSFNCIWISVRFKDPSTTKEGNIKKKIVTWVDSQKTRTTIAFTPHSRRKKKGLNVWMKPTDPPETSDNTMQRISNYLYDMLKQEIPCVEVQKPQLAQYGFSEYSNRLVFGTGVTLEENYYIEVEGAICRFVYFPRQKLPPNNNETFLSPLSDSTDFTTPTDKNPGEKDLEALITKKKDEEIDELKFKIDFKEMTKRYSENKFQMKENEKDELKLPYEIQKNETRVED